MEVTRNLTGGSVLAGYVPREELARQLGCSTRTLDRWHNQRTGPPRTVVGRLVLYRIEAVLQWLQCHESTVVRQPNSKREPKRSKRGIGGTGAGAIRSGKGLRLNAGE